MEGFPIRKPLQVDSDGLGWAGLEPHLHLQLRGRCTWVHAEVVTAKDGRADQQSLPSWARQGGERRTCFRSNTVKSSWYQGSRRKCGRDRRING